jgi:hypothetical protein
MSSSVSGSTTGFAQPPNIKNFDMVQEMVSVIA